MRKITFVFSFLVATLAIPSFVLAANPNVCVALSEKAAKLNWQGNIRLAQSVARDAQICWDEVREAEVYNASRSTHRSGYGMGTYGSAYGGYNGAGYGFYMDPVDQALIQQLLAQPDAIYAVSMDLETGKVESYHPIVKSRMGVEAHARDHSDRSELLATMRVSDEGMKLCPFDDTNHPIGPGTGGAIGAGIGAVIGGAIAGNKGALGGAGTGSIIGLFIGSRNNHDNCLTLSTATTEQVSQNFVNAGQATVQPAVLQAQEEVVVFTPTQAVAGPAASSGSGGFELSNQTRMYVEAYDGETYLGRMFPGATLQVGPPNDRYRGFALVPNREGGLSEDEVDIEPGDSGWDFIEPAVAQGR